jgi:hypothetical protein
LLPKCSRAVGCNALPVARLLQGSRRAPGQQARPQGVSTGSLARGREARGQQGQDEEVPWPGAKVVPRVPPPTSRCVGTEPQLRATFKYVSRLIMWRGEALGTVCLLKLKQGDYALITARHCLQPQPGQPIGDLDLKAFGGYKIRRDCGGS